MQPPRRQAQSYFTSRLCKMENKNGLTTEQIIEDFELMFFSTTIPLNEICDHLCMTQEELYAIPEINEMVCK